jgi:phosphatidate cytidylyltransferase
VDWKTISLIGGVIAILAVATVIGRWLRGQTQVGINPALVQTFNGRLQAWWLMFATLSASFYIGVSATVVLFGFISFWALREFITLTPTRMGDHRTLFWVFFFFTPAQYILVYRAKLEYFSVLIPVYAFLFIPARVAFDGDYRRFLERAAKIQSALMICVYCLSHAPALLKLDLKSVPEVDQPAARVRLLFFFVLVVQINDAFQFIWGRLLGKTVIAPAISANRTWEGFLGGVGTATLVGTLLFWATPFQLWEAAVLALATSVMGSAGAMTMSAIKRDRGVKDYGTLVTGHGGVLDRIDSICFAAPVFYHLARIISAM